MEPRWKIYWQTSGHVFANWETAHGNTAEEAIAAFRTVHPTLPITAVIPISFQPTPI